MDTCPVCGDLARFGVDEVIWELREVVVSACCDENLEGWLETFRSLSRTERAAWMLQETHIHVRDILVSGDVLTWTLDYGLHLQQVSLADAKNFIREHHRHCEPPIGWKYGAAVFNGGELIGVMTAGRPVSAELARQGCIEVNRVCVKETTPRALAENACSMLYGHACREAFKRGHDRVITYTLGTERGTSLRASGFLPVAKTPGGSWDRRARPRTDKTSTVPKVRWEQWRDSASLPVQRCLPLAA